MKLTSLLKLYFTKDFKNRTNFYERALTKTLYLNFILVNKM